MAGEREKPEFVAETVLKRDVFSETVLGHLADDPGQKVALRRLDLVPWWARPLSGWLARRELRGIRAVQGIRGAPVLIHADRDGILRQWAEGTPLQLARPDGPEWYRDARRLLREMRARGVTHNDIAKPQNWLMTPDGRAAVIDFQLASVHRRRGRLFRVMAREDLRHLLKQKRNFAGDLVTPSQWRMLERKALPTRIWMATGKRIYNFITRRLMHWSDGEGTENRVAEDGPRIRAELMGVDGVHAVHLTTFALSGRGVGLYAFVETDLGVDALRDVVSEAECELIQPVAAMPRDADGALREDALALVAANRMDEAEALMAADAPLSAGLRPIIAGRLNLTDRVL